MVSLFGDWFNDMAAVVFVFVLYLIYSIWLNKDRKRNEQALVVSAVVIFVIAIFPFFSKIFFYETNSISTEGGYISLAIGAISLLAIIFGLNRVYPRKE